MRFFLFFFLLTPLFAQDVVILTDNGNTYVVEEAAFNFWKKNAGRGHEQFLGSPRDYDAPLTAQEQKDVHYIITMLANYSFISIAAHKGDLEAAGRRIDHLHPLAFFREVFTNEELKVGLRNIRMKGPWIWDHFCGGICESLAVAWQNNNLTDEQVIDFADIVEVDLGLIYASVQEQQWEYFVQLLIAHVPRKGDYDRYNN